MTLSPLRAIVSMTTLALAGSAFGQAQVRAVFVANNGNLEGSVSSFTVGAGGGLTFVNKVITGTRTTTSQPCAGCNAYELSITPNGKYLASAHAAGDLDGITIFSVAGDASLTQVFQLPLPVGQGTPLDLVWLGNDLLAVTRTDTNPDQLVLYRFNPAVPSLTFLNAVPTGGNGIGYLAVHPNVPVLYANDSGQRVINAYSYLQTGAVTLIDSESTGTPFPLELTITRDGSKMYASCGISDGGNKVLGLNIASDGTLSLMKGQPFISPGSSPSNVFPTGDMTTLAVGHGTDATVRTFTINQGTGALVSTGHMFDVGLQGTLGDVRTMGRLLFVTDNSTATDGIMGLYSFTIDPAGALIQNGTIALTNGIAPRSLATWVFADLNGDGSVGPADLGILLGSWGPCAVPGDCPADLNGDGVVGPADLGQILGNWG